MGIGIVIAPVELSKFDSLRGTVQRDILHVVIANYITVLVRDIHTGIDIIVVIEIRSGNIAFINNFYGIRRRFHCFICIISGFCNSKAAKHKAIRNLNLVQSIPPITVEITYIIGFDKINIIKPIFRNIGSCS